MNKLITMLTVLAAMTIGAVAHAAECCKPGAECCKPGAECCKK